MADIAHTVPSVITTKDGSEFGFDRPGLQITRFDAGPVRSRDWLGYNLRTYDLDPSLWQSGTTALQQWSAFWNHIGGGAECGYIVEPVSETHRDLVCGGLGDASQTTFPIPIVSPSSVTVFVGGVPQEAAAYTVHTAANKLGDTGATASAAANLLSVECTDALSSGVSLDGLSCVKVVPAGGANPTERVYMADAATFPATTPGEEYTGVASWLATAASAQNYNAQIWWFTDADAYISTSNGSDVSTPAGSWMTSSVTATAPVTAAKAVAGVRRNDTSGTSAFYVDCFALNPGDYDRWHLPSQSPGLIEFAAAPAAGARITATATGCRVSRCRFEPGSSWRVSSAGHAASRSIRAVEDIEV